MFIDSNGIVFHGSKRLAWSDVSRVTLIRILGLPHLRIEKTTGQVYRLPLYYVGKASIYDALLVHAPKGIGLIEALSTSNRHNQ